MSEPVHPNYRLQDLQRRWERDPSSRVYQQLAEEYRKSDQLVEAAVVLEDGLGRRPNDIAARVALGRCRLELGQTPEAIEALENVLARDPAHHVANKLLLDAYLRAGDLVQARERLDIHRLLNDRDPELEHLGFRLQQLEGDPSSSTAASQSEAAAPSAESSSTAAEHAEHATPASVTPEASAEGGTPRDDAPVSDPDFASNHPQEALQMANRRTDPKANDVFDFGQEAPVADSFAALWAELGSLASSSATPAKEPETTVAADDAAPAADLGELASNPFAQLLSASEPPPVESNDVWQQIAEAGSMQTPAESSTTAESSGDDTPPLEALAAIEEETAALAEPEPFVDEMPEVASEVAALEAAVTDGDSVETVTVDMADAPTQPFQELVAEARSDEEIGDEDPTGPVAQVEQAADSTDEEMQSPWEAAHQEAARQQAAQEEAAQQQAAQEEAAQQQAAQQEAAALETAAIGTEAPAPESREPAVLEPAAQESAVHEPAVREVPGADASEAAFSEPAALAPAVAADEAPEIPEPTASAPLETFDDVAEATVTLGSLYLKQGHREEAARIFEKILRRSPGNQAALAGLNSARRPEMASLSAMDLLADQSLSGTIPADANTKKILVLTNYLQHLKARSKESHVH